MLNYILLQEAAATSGMSSWFSNPETMQQVKFWGMMILIFVVFYFFMIRPQSKKQKEIQKQRESMKKGDKVVTAGGIYGEIKEVKDNAFIITIDKDVTIKVSKESVFADASDAQQAAEKK
jgi:preprotein translocase subunit YajC